MTTAGAALGAEERAVVELVDSLGSDFSANGEEFDTMRAILAEYGIWTPGAAAEIGGSDAPLRTVLLAISRLARHSPALALASAHAHACTVLLGSAPQWRSHGESVCAGATAALVDGTRLAWEPAGSAARCTGDVARVDVGAPTPLLVVARERTAALVAADTPGVRFGEPTPRTGLAGAATRSVHFADAELAEHPDVPVDRAWTALRWAIAAIAHGITSAATNAAWHYTRQRYQFGGPISEIPTVADALARCDERVRTGMHALLAATEDDGPATAAAMLNSTMDSAIDVATTAVQLHGGYGYLAEYPVERLLRDAISLRAAAHPAR